MLDPSPIPDAATERLRSHYQAEIDKAQTALAILLAKLDGREPTAIEKGRLTAARTRIAKFQRGLRGERV